MIWLALAVLALVISVAAEARQQSRWPQLAGAATLGLLALWLWSLYGTAIFSASEQGLTKGIFFGALLAMAGELLILAGRGRWAMALIPLAALSYAAGLDVLRPDAYGYLPAAIIGLLILVVLGRAFLALNRPGKANTLALLAHSLAMALMLYAALYKLIDRGWALPWAYSVAAGALLLANAQLWLGWEEVFGRRRVPAWAQTTAYLGGQAMLIIAAGFHYLSFL